MPRLPREQEAELLRTFPERAKAHVRGFFASLTPEQRKGALAYRGPEDHGDPKFLRARTTA